MHDEVADFVVAAAQRLGRQVQADSAELRDYVANIMQMLASALGEPGYDEALVAARDSVALFAGLQIVDSADAGDRELLGSIGGALSIAVRAM
jgi:hypothetical protein